MGSPEVGWGKDSMVASRIPQRAPWGNIAERGGGPGGPCAQICNGVGSGVLPGAGHEIQRAPRFNEALERIFMSADRTNRR